jgi:leucyl/phenylalanyl-tRNA--protein transferase
MFSREANCSKLALWALCEQVRRWSFSFIDCQVHTEHLERLGARDVPRSRFLRLLGTALESETRRGVWRFDQDLLNAMD